MQKLKKLLKFNKKNGEKMENLEISYEEAIQEFEQIINKLSSDITFDESLKCLQRGKELALLLKKKQEDFSGKVFEIKKSLSGETYEEEI